MLNLHKYNLSLFSNRLVYINEKPEAPVTPDVAEAPEKKLTFQELNEKIKSMVNYSEKVINDSVRSALSANQNNMLISSTPLKLSDFTSTGEPKGGELKDRFPIMSDAMQSAVKDFVVKVKALEKVQRKQSAVVDAVKAVSEQAQKVVLSLPTIQTGDPLDPRSELPVLDLAAYELKADEPIPAEPQTVRIGTTNVDSVRDSVEGHYTASIEYLIKGEDKNVSVKSIMDEFKVRRSNRIEYPNAENTKAILDRSTDGKSIRVEVFAPGPDKRADLAPQVKTVNYTGFRYLDENDQGTKEFERGTYDQEIQEQVNEKRVEAEGSIDWLKSEEVPAGTMVGLEIVDEKEQNLRVIRKEVDGSLSVLTVHQIAPGEFEDIPHTKTAFNPDKPGSVIPIDPDKPGSASPVEPNTFYHDDVINMIGQNTSLFRLESTPKMTEKMAQNEIKSLLGQLEGYRLMPNGNTELALTENKIKDLVAKYDIDNWRYEYDSSVFGDKQVFEVIGNAIAWGPVKEKPGKAKDNLRYASWTVDRPKKRAA